MSNKKILVAMSGGVDSAVAALIVSSSHKSVAGITMKLWSDSERFCDSFDASPDQNCLDAKQICDRLSIPHYSISLGDSFRECVVSRFIDEYIAGRTPNPCVECNKSIKFGKLFDAAEHYGYDTLATGHYAVIEKNPSGSFSLKRASDASKDQSYFLWSIDRSRLSQIILPLGNMTKSEIREIAEQNGFENAHRKDSQDICFIPDGEYASFIKAHSGSDFPAGKFIDTRGNALGAHSGIINYTVGQRKGLGIALGQPMFVKEKNALANTVTLSTDKELYSDTLTAHRLNFLECASLSSPERLTAKIRYRHAPAAATVTQIDADTLSVKFDDPQRAAAAGQSLVLYDGDTVVGGGIIG
ncbi:MAG: tRNA 2-thiouridine(34) synthase MnmA [Clostridia bacterium]|nr:tRNA 2-thiouridine(34) synthase MnmA [Clostridia bacterium]